jgi:hypothetical protein
MKRLIFFLSAIIIYIIPLFAQAPDTLWTKTYGRPDRDEGLCVQQTFDGGFIITGYTEIRDQGTGYIQWKVYLLKTDEYGDTLWTKNYGSFAHHVGNFVQQTSDSGYIIAGGVTHFNNDVNVHLIKTDINGNLLWEKSIGGMEYDEGNCVRETFDGGYIIAGYTESFGAGISDVYLIKTDANGVVDWARTYGGQLWEQGNSVQQTSDSGFVLVGYKTISTSSSGADTDVYLIKTDANGDTLWTRLYGVLEGEYRDEGWSVQQTTDGGYIISAETWHPGGIAWLVDAYLIKTDANGDTTWTRAYDIFGNWEVPRSVWQTLDGGYIIAGYSSFYPLNHEVLLIKIKADGDTVWTKNLGRNLGSYPYDEGWSVQQTTDGGYIVAGFSWNYPISDSDVYLIKLAPEPVKIDNRVDVPLPRSFALHQNYPNPFNPATTIEYALPEGSNIKLKVFNSLGQEVATLINGYIQAGRHKVIFDAKSLSSGVYYYRIEAGSFVQVHKMILMR